MPPLDRATVRVLASALLHHAARLEAPALTERPLATLRTMAPRVSKLLPILMSARKTSYAEATASVGNVRRYAICHVTAMDLLVATLAVAIEQRCLAPMCDGWRVAAGGEAPVLRSAVGFLRLYEKAVGVAALPAVDGEELDDATLLQLATAVPASILAEAGALP